MINPAKIEKALAQIDDQRQTRYVEKAKKIIAEVEKNIKENPFSVIAQFKKLESLYAKASEADQKLYCEIEDMLGEAIAEHTKILIDHAKEFIQPKS